MSNSCGADARQNELNYLKNCTSLLISGKFNIVVISGDSGIGKSWIAEEFLKSIVRENIITIRCTCFDNNTPPNFLCNQIAEFVNSQRTTSYKISDILVGEDNYDQMINRPSNDALAGKSLLFDFYSDLLIRISAKYPILLMIDDLNWLDVDSLDFLLHSCRTFASVNAYRKAPILMMCTADRTTLAKSAKRALSIIDRQPWSSEIQLGSFNTSETRNLMASDTKKRISNSFARLVRQYCEGNPRLILEVTKKLVNSENVSEVGGYLIANKLDIPSVFQESRSSYNSYGITSYPLKIRPGDDSRNTLEFASLLGRRFSISKLLKVLSLETSKLKFVLAQLSDVVEPQEDTYQFKDHSQWLGVIDQIDRTRRQQMHGEIAERLAKANGPPDLESDWQVLQHLRSAGSFGSSELRRSLGRRVGDQASAVFSWDTAAQGYEIAAAAEHSARDRGKLHMMAGTCYRYGWDIGPSIRQFRLAQDAFSEATDSRGVAEALVHEARQKVRKLSPGELTNLEPFQNALDLCGNDEALRCWTLTRISDAYSHAHKSDEAIIHASQAREIAEQIGNDQLLNDACTFLGLAQMLAGDMLSARESYEDALACAERLNMKWMENIPQQRLTMAHLMSGDIAKAAWSNQSGLKTTADTRYSGEACMAFSGKAMIESVRARIRECEESARETLQLFEQSRYPFGPYHALRALACTRCMFGDVPGAIDAIQPLVRPGEIFDDPKPRMLDVVSLMEVYIISQNQAVEQWPSVRREAERRTVLQYYERYLSRKVTAFSLTECCLIADLVETLRISNLTSTLIEDLEEFNNKGVKFSLGWCLLVPRILSQLYLISGESEKAISLLNEAIEAAKSADAFYELARVSFLLARIQASMQTIDHTAQAHGLARHAAAIFEDLGLSSWVDRVSNFCLDHGVQLESYDPSQGGTVLHNRSEKILEYIARGSTTAQIAQELILSPGTIKSESNTIARKLYLEDGHTEMPISLTLMVTDIEQSTSMIERLGDRKARRLIHLHDQIVRNAVISHGGVEIKNRGDGFLASFHSAPEALVSARTIQQDLSLLSEHNDQWPVRVRIGLHSGELLLEDEGLFGLNIHVAVRISELCPPSRVVMSDAVLKLARNLDLPCSLLGRVELRGITVPLEIHEYMWWDHDGNKHD